MTLSSRYVQKFNLKLIGFAFISVTDNLPNLYGSSDANAHKGLRVCVFVPEFSSCVGLLSF